MSKVPSFYAAFRERHPDVVKAYEALGDAARAAGPLPPAQAELVKLALAAGARLEGGVHSHVRRALEAGATPDQCRHVALLAITTLGFPSAMAIRAMVDDELAKADRRA
jgi:alkylhydroperoxidase/carboxymuconolactone decarboxylase family protein YurZ